MGVYAPTAGRIAGGGDGPSSSVGEEAFSGRGDESWAQAPERLPLQGGAIAIFGATHRSRRPDGSRRNRNAPTLRKENSLIACRCIFYATGVSII